RRIGFRKWAIIPPRAADCIAIFVKQFLQSRVWRKKSGCGEYQHYQNILVVSHQGVLSLLIARLIGMPAESMWHFRVDQGCW
ncbi:histidine phosphatase family protein, partial [Escherichia coli]|uniref:histidine phosphatase family protein n=1 Tax=Escherichia coli TaxID=562 RepID=UPI003EE227EB